jgi:hypothetical protein
MCGIGPIYGVELIDAMPVNHDNPTGMQQAMPSRSNLLGVKDYMQGQRVVAGYEVLLNRWREQAEEIERLQAIVDADDDYLGLMRRQALLEIRRGPLESERQEQMAAWDLCVTTRKAAETAKGKT